MSRRLAIFVTLVSLLGVAESGRAAPPTIGGCPVFPVDHALNIRIDGLPVHPSSAAWINSMGAGRSLHPDFGTIYESAPIGIPHITTTNADPAVPVNFTAYGNESDPNPYNIPLSAPVEGGAASDGDRHVLAINTSTCELQELYRAVPQAGSWDADSAAKYDLNAYVLRTDGWTSADAAGLPILPLLVRKDEADAGPIEHAFRVTASRTNGPHLWPARHDAGDTGNPNDPPMGARFRLKAGKDLSGFSTRIQRIFQAMKSYGLIMADNGSSWFVTGEHNLAWDDDELVSAFSQLHGSDFEAVDASCYILDPNSAQARTFNLGDFCDVPSTYFAKAYIGALAKAGVTGGCAVNPPSYCPTSPVTRDQMAVFLLKAKNGPAFTPPACATPPFPDVPCGNVFAAWIQALVAASITAGCGGGLYCPTNPVTREQMAVFLLKTLKGASHTPPPCTTAPFADVPCSSPFAPWIQELVADGITAGCGATTYCPTNAITRDQMAVFLVKTFSLPFP
jgi:hypothetical protein